MANTNVSAIVQAQRDWLHARCKDLGPEEYMEVCETISADMDGNIDALKDENPDLFS